MIQAIGFDRNQFGQARKQLPEVSHTVGSIEMTPNAIPIAELAVDKQAQMLLMSVSSRRQLNVLPDDF